MTVMRAIVKYLFLVLAVLAAGGVPDRLEHIDAPPVQMRASMDMAIHGPIQ